MKPRPTLRQRVARFLIRTAQVFGGVYLLALTLLYFNQESLIFPGARSHGKAGAAVKPPAGSELVTLSTASGNRVAALFGRAQSGDGSSEPNPRRRPSVLLFYGNGTYLHTVVPTFQLLRRLGFNVLVPEYVGYGLSTGSPGERGCRETADAALAYLRSRKEVDRSRVVAFGYSLGGAVAIDLAARNQLAGLVACNTFTSMGEMVTRFYPWVPLFLLRHPFPSLRRMPEVACPALLVHGTRDTLVPGWMCDRLAAAAAAPAVRIDVDGAEHSNLFAVGGKPFLRRVQSFVAGFGPSK
jgi:pimeloyl-ACP methyl ester carboxylesterase